MVIEDLERTERLITYLEEDKTPEEIEKSEKNVLEEVLKTFQKILKNLQK